MNHQHTNRLIHETSPYLLQHAHNPVDWYSWSTEALQKAKDENKVILVSIGYSACHWCHVMERESFENENTAKLMNENFINIKIDREERPDIDHIYMDAVQAITGSGGWPLNVFLTPQAKPFYGGTYFPPIKAFNRPSWTEVLQSIMQAWRERRNEIESQAENLTDYLDKSGNFSKENILDITFNDAIGVENAEAIFSAIMRSADMEWGGFGKAPKFPQTFTIQYLLHYYYYTGHQQALAQALLSIDKMLQGGIYDHVAGGLARYSTDNEWLAPHFEKMLYDNALFIVVLCDAFQITKDKKYEAAINKTLSFILTELTNSQGAFYAALDADSEGEEGKYYVWQKGEIEELLGTDSVLFCECFDVTEKGNWDEKNILRLSHPVEEFAALKHLNVDTFREKIDLCLEKLKIARSKRIEPGLDDKILLSWNALMLGAVAKAAIILQNDRYKAAAISNFNFLLHNFTGNTKDNLLLHTWKNDCAKYPGFLEDYAFLIDACLQMYALTFDSNCLQKAYDYCQYTIDHFSDEDGVFFYYTNRTQQDVIFRKKDIYDSATPSPNAVMAGNLYKLSLIYDKREWLQRANKMLDVISPVAIKYPVSFALWSSLLLQRVKGINEITIFGKNGTIAASDILYKNYVPNKLVMVSDTINSSFPFLNSKVPGEPLLIYLCKNQVCQQPVKEVSVLVNLINELDKF